MPGAARLLARVQCGHIDALQFSLVVAINLKPGQYIHRSPYKGSS
jgi:hypothetical protein